MKRGLVITALLVLAGLAMWFYRLLRGGPLPPQPRTVEQVINAIGPAVDWRMKPVFWKAGVSYPPKRIALLGFKEEKRMELYAANEDGKFHRITSWPIQAASGKAGPKLREGDLQVPEGSYRIVLLNPNSNFHLSLRVNYPNDDDFQRAREEGRDVTSLGCDIMIHGGEASIGCMAMGDPAVEEIFVIAERAGLDNIDLLIAPCDFRAGKKPELPESAPVWTADLHRKIDRELTRYPVGQGNH